MTTDTIRIHPDDKLHVILDAIGAMRAAIEGGDAPWADYSGSFGGDEDAPDTQRREAYLEALEGAELDITLRLDVGRPL